MEDLSWLFDVRTLVALKLIAIPIKLLLLKKAARFLPWKRRKKASLFGPPGSDVVRETVDDR